MSAMLTTKTPQKNTFLHRTRFAIAIGMVLVSSVLTFIPCWNCRGIKILLNRYGKYCNLRYDQNEGNLRLINRF